MHACLRRDSSWTPTATLSYELTDDGRELAELARIGGAAFIERLASLLIAAHPYLRRILVALGEGPIVCPVVSEGDIQRGRDESYRLAGWGQWGAERIAAGVDPERVARTIAEHVKRRFGGETQERPSNKAMSEVFNDALAVAGFEARGITLDANTIKTLMRWGGGLLIFDQSRYVPEHADTNVIWLACDIATGPEGMPVATRRGLASHGTQVAYALVRAYEQQSEALDTMLEQPYLPVHEVRAQAAFETNTMRALGDLVLTRLIDGLMPDIGVTAIPYIGTSSLPRSEPAFRHRGRRRLEIQMVPGSNTSRFREEHILSTMFDHMEEAWGLEQNPFPHAAISNDTSPYSDRSLPQRDRRVPPEDRPWRAPGQSPGRLPLEQGTWRRHWLREDLADAPHRCRDQRSDWGEDIQSATGMKPNRMTKLAAGFSELNTNQRTGLYPVIFNAVLSMATGPDSPLLRAHAAICEELDTDSASAIRTKLIETRLDAAPTSAPLRPDFTDWFTASPKELPTLLGSVTQTTQLRSGIDFLHFALIALRAAGVEKVFLMIDQLEDLATNKALPASKRRREIGRIRDLLETEPFAGMLHQTYTFHATAARELDSFWEANRLPSFEDTPSNQAAVVVLRGMRDDDQVEALLKTWMIPHRNDVEIEDDLVPFDRSALSVLRRALPGPPRRPAQQSQRGIRSRGAGPGRPHRRRLCPRLLPGHAHAADHGDRRRRRGNRLRRRDRGPARVTSYLSRSPHSPRRPSCSPATGGRRRVARAGGVGASRFRLAHSSGPRSAPALRHARAVRSGIGLRHAA